MIISLISAASAGDGDAFVQNVQLSCMANAHSPKSPTKAHGWSPHLRSGDRSIHACPHSWISRILCLIELSTNFSIIDSKGTVGLILIFAPSRSSLQPFRAFRNLARISLGVDLFEHRSVLT